MQRYFLLVLVVILAQNLSAQEGEITAIKNQAANFSKFYMDQDYESMLAIYTADAKIFPDKLEILSDEDLIKYWSPNPKMRTIYHKLIPIEIELVNETTANDFGYFEGASENIENGKKINWKGKYLVVWKKEGGIWKMYLDIWNSINN